jgi:hypothetical protein
LFKGKGKNEPMQFITGAILFGLGYLILKGINSGKTDTQVNFNYLHTQMECDRLRSENNTLRLKVQQLESRRQFDNDIAFNAIAREDRAKCALKAVLQTHGCTGDQIEQVMKEIDQ